MPDAPRDSTTAPISDQEMAPVVSQLAVLSRLALKMATLCIDLNESIPQAVQSQVDAKVAAALAEFTRPGPTFYRSPGPTPDEMDARFPPGRGDQQEWHVVCVGREPGLYATSAEANDQVLGVPNQSRKKKDSRQEALLYYRTQYGLGEVLCVSEVPPLTTA
ncbi:hypothetical protein C8R47DRAFT_1205575 [Mycena vitilis]|nr:hypothetical protein C8R47DRAFT_1205575 [Mycena vitilis]